MCGGTRSRGRSLVGGDGPSGSCLRRSGGGDVFGHVHERRSGPGDPDSRAGSGMVSSEGPTPSKGEGPIAHGSGFGDESDSDRSGATVRSDQPIPRVLISSSGGASTSVGAEPVDGDPQSGTNGPGDGRCGRAPTTAPPTSAPAPPAIAVAVTAALATASVPFAVRPNPPHQSGRRSGPRPAVRCL